MQYDYDRLSVAFDIAWSDSLQKWVVRESRLRWVGDKTFCRNSYKDEAEMQAIADEANTHHFSGENYGGYIPPCQEAILAICESASENPYLQGDVEAIKRAILTACESFGTANYGHAPKLHVVEALANKILPCYVAACLEWVVKAQPKPIDPLFIRGWHSDRESLIHERLVAACDAAGVVSPDRWWIQDMLRAFDNLPPD